MSTGICICMAREVAMYASRGDEPMARERLRSFSDLCPTSVNRAGQLVWMGPTGKQRTGGARIPRQGQRGQASVPPRGAQEVWAEQAMSDFVTQSNVLLRPGWSRSVLKLLGDPDAKKKIPGRSNLAFLYLVERVLAVEASADFLVVQAALGKRKASAKEAVQTKTDNLLSAIAAMPVTVVRKIDILERAMGAYNARNFASDRLAESVSDPQFLDRICVNFIRHELTRYDYALEKTAGKTGKTQAIDAIRVKIFEAISSVYPEFDCECKRQLAAKSA